MLVSICSTVDEIVMGSADIGASVGDVIRERKTAEAGAKGGTALGPRHTLRPAMLYGHVYLHSCRRTEQLA